MDPASDDEEAQAMALAMGFSTFGTKPSAKKRKFNPSTDAFVEGQDLEKLDRGGKKGKGTGGNMIPVGVRNTRMPTGPVEAASEEDLKTAQAGTDAMRPSIRKSPERSVSDTEDGPNYMDTSRPPPITRKSPERSEDEEEDGPRYMDTSEEAPIHRKVDTTEAEEFLSTLPLNPASSTLSMRLPPPINPGIPPIRTLFGTKTHTMPIQPPPPGASTWTSLSRGTSNPALTPMSPPPGLHSKPPPGLSSNFRAPSPTGSSHSSMSTNTRGGFSNSGRRERNEKWYEGYYDPNFNQNPWEALERVLD